MAYSPTELNNPPTADPEYDAAAEPTPDKPNTFTPPEQPQAEGTMRPKADPGATSYDYGPAGKTTV